MALTADDQLFLDFALAALPRWMNPSDEFLHGAAKIFGSSVKAQLDYWFSQTLIGNATGATATTPDWLRQHARDRGTDRQNGESDVALRARLRNVPDALTRGALLDAADAIIAAEGIVGSAAMVEMPRDAAHLGTFTANTGTGGTFASVAGYPTTAAALAAAAGYGTWTAGWMCDEASGNLASVIGAFPLTATGGAYGFGGPRAGADKAIGFAGTADKFSGGNVLNVGVGDDLAVLWVGYQTAQPDAYRALVSKYPASTDNGWYIVAFPSGTLGGPDGLWFYGTNGAGAPSFNASGNILPLNKWYVGLAALDRATGKAIVSTIELASGIVRSTGLVAAAADAYTNAGAFTFGNNDAASSASTTSRMSMVSIAVGPGAAAGIPANIATALANFAAVVSNPAPGYQFTPTVHFAAPPYRDPTIARLVQGYSVTVAGAANAMNNGTYPVVGLSGNALLVNSTCLAGVDAGATWTINKLDRRYNITGATGDWNINGSVGISSASALSGDGWMQFRAVGVPGDGNWYLLGLSATDVTTQYAGVLYGWMLRQDTGHAVVYESGGLVFDSGAAWVKGDTFRVERVGTTILYKKNGALVYTSLVPSSGALMIDTAFLSTNGTVADVRLYDRGIERRPIIWQNITNLSVGGNVLTPHGKAFCSRGFRCTHAGKPASFVLMLPFGATAGTLASIAEMLRQKKAAGILALVERRLNL